MIRMIRKVESTLNQCVLFDDKIGQNPCWRLIVPAENHRFIGLLQVLVEILGNNFKVTKSWR